MVSVASVVHQFEKSKKVGVRDPSERAQNRKVEKFYAWSVLFLAPIKVLSKPVHGQAKAWSRRWSVTNSAPLALTMEGKCFL